MIQGRPSMLLMIGKYHSFALRQAQMKVNARPR